MCESKFPHCVIEMVKLAKSPAMGITWGQSVHFDVILPRSIMVLRALKETKDKKKMLEGKEEKKVAAFSTKWLFSVWEVELFIVTDIGTHQTIL